MADDGFYYLHVNGDLIWKKFEPEPSDFVLKTWKLDVTDRAIAWLITIEALALGARKNRIKELVVKWELTDEDAQMFVKHVCLEDGKQVFNLSKNNNQWCASFHEIVDLDNESQVGFGKTALEAFANLAKIGLREKFGKTEIAD